MVKFTLMTVLSVLLLDLQPVCAQSANLRAGKRPELPATVKDSRGSVVLSYARSYALVVGISDYTNGWTDLPRVKDEVHQIQLMLESQGFHVTPVMNPGHVHLRKALSEFYASYGYSEHNKDNRLLVFFSGHGYTRAGGKGYLVAADAPSPDDDPATEGQIVGHSLAMEDIVSGARQVEVRHVLYIFDACFSGTIFNVKSNKVMDPTIEKETSEATRQFISAGGAEEEVPAISSFVPLLIDAIANSRADSNKDGYVLGSELGNFLKANVPIGNKSQHPDHGWINDPMLNRGDFVFEGKFRERDNPSAAHIWAQIKDSNEEIDFMEFISMFPEGELPTLARQRLRNIRNDLGIAVSIGAATQKLERDTQKLVIDLAAPTGDSPAFVRIDDDLLEQLCGDKDGCDVMLGVTGWSFGTRTVNVPYFGPPCRFFLRTVGNQRHWSIAAQCGLTFATFTDQGHESTWNSEAPSWFRIYQSGQTGIDGIDTVGPEEDPNSGDRMPVLVLDRACHFSETPPRVNAGKGELWPDSSAGFFLFASTFAWGDKWQYPDPQSWPPRATGRACHLIVED